MEDKTFEDLKDYFELLAHIMPLGNWRVSLEATGSHSMTHYAGEPEAYGVCLKNRNMQYAEIFINTEKEHEDKYGETWEHTLIHEMLHVITDELCEYLDNKYPDLQEDDLYCIKVERLINMLSYTIYDALQVERCSCDECSCSESENTLDNQEHKQSKEDKQMEDSARREIIDAVVEATMAESRKLTTSRKTQFRNKKL